MSTCMRVCTNLYQMTYNVLKIKVFLVTQKFTLSKFTKRGLYCFFTFDLHLHGNRSPKLMLCSTSKQNSGGSKWLDRLQSSKGFPPYDFVNLEHFLLHHTSTSLNSPPINPALLRSEDISSEFCSNGAGSEKEPVLEASVNDGGTKLVNAFSHVLSELFNMGESSNYAAHKKESRKQSNPRIFSTFTSAEFSNVSGS
ncbi:unnamed protein product [Cuscuta epithymum]|uniref:Uncharacterized protein n=1 Tax=Cuscuta epithymum TaxID=186058 RepID=A0AAV0C7M7_9ASTE|nr:unnamed protein product [Cuscuta epithymum]